MVRYHIAVATGAATCGGDALIIDIAATCRTYKFNRLLIVHVAGKFPKMSLQFLRFVTVISAKIGQ